jgi:hypothetical protein
MMVGSDVASKGFTSRGKTNARIPKFALDDSDQDALKRILICYLNNSQVLIAP